MRRRPGNAGKAAVAVRARKPGEVAAGDAAARKAGARAAARRAAREEKRIADSPFAVLRELKLNQPAARKPGRKPKHGKKPSERAGGGR